MKYRVVLQPRALLNLEEQYAYIAAQSPDAAAKWFNRFVIALQGLSTFPKRCPVAPESRLVGREVRQFVFGRRGGTRRAYFVVEGQTVSVLCIRHAAQRDVPLEDLITDI